MPLFTQDEEARVGAKSNPSLKDGYHDIHALWRVTDLGKMSEIVLSITR